MTPRSFPQHPAGSIGTMGFPTEVVLVRHARSADVVPGEPASFDPPLHSEGVAQAEALARRLHPKTLDAVYASDLIRTQQTAAPVLEVAAAHDGGSVLVVSHGGAINAFLAEVLGVPRTQFTAVENTGVTIVRYGLGRRMLLTVNDTHHLYDPLLGLPG
jgi:broad specificity phosphatase PhoE